MVPPRLAPEDPRDVLVRHLLPVVGAWCGALGGAGVDREEAAHDVLLIVLDKVDTLPADVPVEALAWSVTRKVLANHRRRAWWRRWVPGAAAPTESREDGGNILWRTTLPLPSDAAPVLADFDGDGLAEVGIPMTFGYAMLDGDGSLLWRADTSDGSSWSTSSVAFDFDGDGADVDGDGSADLLFGNDGAYGPEIGMYVLNDPTWPSTRGTWSQYAYLPELVTEMGGTVAAPTMGWETGHPRFHGQPSEPRDWQAANLRPTIASVCADECAQGRLSVWAQLENDGAVEAPAGVLVELWGRSEDGATLLASERTTAPIASGERTEGFGWVLDPAPTGLTEVIVLVDGDLQVVERSESDNDAIYADGLCP